MSASIAKLNDEFRRNFDKGFALLSEKIANLHRPQLYMVLESIRAFDAFTEDNDPHGEHDFAEMEVLGVGKVCWRIVYYDTRYQNCSPNPADPTVTRRVLIIMRPGEL